MDPVVQWLAMLAMVGAALFGILALIETGRWAVRRLEPIRTHGPHPG